VRAHIFLKVKICKLISRSNFKELGKLGIGVNFSSVLRILELVVANVLVDVAGDLGASHLGSRGLVKKGGELIADLGGLDEATGRASSSLALALRALLLGDLDITSPGLF